MKTTTTDLIHKMGMRVVYGLHERLVRMRRRSLQLMREFRIISGGVVFFLAARIVFRRNDFGFREAMFFANERLDAGYWEQIERARFRQPRFFVAFMMMLGALIATLLVIGFVNYVRR